MYRLYSPRVISRWNFISFYETRPLVEYPPESLRCVLKMVAAGENHISIPSLN
jgi:hypothetical protein